jgi:POT family proton-dependent oligopeptide transporter
VALVSKQPKEMYFLALIEMCQRFAFWGIGNLLVLYLVGYHRFSTPAATQLYGLFTGVAFILPLIGGYIADRTSYRWAVIAGSISTTLGCLLMAFGQMALIYPALFFAAIGASVFTPSIYTILGSLYKTKHALRDGGFSIYYAMVNIGVFLATFILGALGHAHAWSVAFLLAACVQLLGLWIFLKVSRSPQFADLHLPSRKRTIDSRKTPLKKYEKARIGVICILALVSILFWMSYNQGWSSMSIFALRYTNNHYFGFNMPASWILSLESLYLVILAFPLAWLYQWLSKRHADPTPPMKTSLSLIAMGLCFAIMMIGARQIPLHAYSAAISPLYPMGAYFLMALGEMLLAPIGLSLVTHLSPHRYTAFLVGVWYVAIGIAFYLGGLLAGLVASMHISAFFDIFVVATFVPAAILLFYTKKLNQMRHIDKN